MSNHKCCVPGCANRQGSEAVLHKFPNPAKDRELFNTWLHAIGGEIIALSNDFIFKYRRVCHIHFEEKYWCRNNRLSNIAVPTKNMPGLSKLKFTIDQQRLLRPIENKITAVPASKVLPGTLYDVNVDAQHRLLRSIENIESAASSSKVLPGTLHDVNVDAQHRMLRSIENIKSAASSSEDGPATLNVAPQPNSQNTKENIQIKTNLESATKRHQVTVEQQQRIQKTAAVGVGAQIEENKGHRKLGGPKLAPKKLRKRVHVTSAEEELYRKVVRLGVKLSKCRNKAKKQATKIRALKNITSNPYLLQTLDNMKSTAKILTVMQFREHKKGDKGRRFTLKEKILALSIMKNSPKGYRFMRKIFILPSPQTLIRLLSMADIRPGINKNTFEQIKKTTEKMAVQDRLCIVLFDEMSLKPNVAYNERKDKVSGFVTNGEETKPEYADHAQVFMIRGLMRNYKQPVAYTFSQAATKGPELAKQLKAVISHLQDAGLIVVATVCDQGTNNVQCIKLLQQESRGYLLRNGKEPKENIILINDHEIIPIYDPPHLIKCIRNNLISKDLQYKLNNEVKTAKWAHIEQLHQENPGYKGIRLVPKLTDAHCIPSKIPRMKVKFASQVFSQTVASTMGYLADKGILPAECKDTADILLFFDRLFDSVNGSHKKNKHAKPLLGPATPTSCHLKVWRDSKIVLKNMKFVNHKKNTNENVPTLKNWVSTLEGIEILLKKLNTEYNITSVWLRHLNQDPIENFFGAIRSHGCRNVNPTPEKFESAFATLLVNSLSSPHAPGANCEIDDCNALHEVIITGKGCKDTNCDLDKIPDITITPLEQKNDPRQLGGLQYVSGYFIKNAKKNVFKGCKKCKEELMSENEPEYLRYREFAKKKWLCSPSDSLLVCISELQDIIYGIIKENLEKNNLSELIKTMILISVDFDYISCEIHKEKVIDYLMNISCRFFVYNYCKEINKILCNKRDCDDDEDKFKIKAKKMFMKCFKRKK